MLPIFSEIKYLGNNPSKADYGYFHYVQGIANDGKNWYLSTNKNIRKWGSSHGIPSGLPKSAIEQGIVIEGYDHYGDIDFHNDLLYVPLEKKNKSKDPMLIVMDADLNLIDSTILKKNAEDEYKNEVP